MSEQRKRYKGGFFQYVSSYNGEAIFNLTISRTTRKGTSEYIQIEVEISRSDIGCIHRAIKAFADKEREQVGNMPL